MLVLERGPKAVYSANQQPQLARLGSWLISFCATPSYAFCDFQEETISYQVRARIIEVWGFLYAP